MQEKNSNVEGVVEVVKEAYSILTLPQSSHAVAYVLSTNINSTGTAFTKFKVGQTVQINITQTPETSDVTKAGLSKQRAIGVAVAKKVQTEALLTSKRMVKEAVDPEIKSLEDFTPGRIVKGRVQSIKEGQVNVVLGANLKGRVHITEVADKLEDLTDPRHPFKGFKVGDVRNFKVIGFHDAKSHAFLPFTHNNPVSKVVVELTARPEEMALPQHELTKRGKEELRIEGLRIGEKYLGFVQSTTEDAVWIHLSTQALGRLSVFELPVDMADVSDLESRFPSGSAGEVYVLSVNAEKKALDLTMKAKPEKLDLKTLKEGKILVGRVTKVNPDQGLVVQLGPQIYGRVQLTDLRDEYVKQPTEGFEKGDVVKCFVLGVDVANKQVDLSLRPSRVGEALPAAAKAKKGKKKEVDGTPSAPAVAAPEITDIKDLEADTVVVGYIRYISEKGCFVSLNRNLAARVKISELSDAFIKDWKTAFKKGQLVKGRILRLV